jgi:hypothetical protein
MMAAKRFATNPKMNHKVDLPPSFPTEEYSHTATTMSSGSLISVRVADKKLPDYV